MDTSSFLKAVVTADEGWFNLLIGPPDGSGWHEEWFQWPNQLPEILATATREAVKNNVYFTAHLFEIKRSTKDNVLPNRTLQCDLDDAVLPSVNPPTVLVETSPGRHQGFWLLRDTLEPQLLEGLSKQLTYSIPDADRSGWSLGHKMRLPGTYNYKYPSGPKAVKVISAALTLYKNLSFGVQSQLTADDEATDEWTPEPLQGVGPRELYTNIKASLPRRIAAQYDARQPDRSAALWALTLALFRIGLDRNQVFWVARASANNKFADNKYHADLDLAKDVLRAERNLRRGSDSTEDIRSKILDARRLPGLVSERRAYIAAMVRDAMAQQGTFVAADTGEEWYVREDTGRPIPLTRANDYLNSLLEIRYGLNASEPEQRYVINSMIATTKERGRPGILAALSHYDASSNTVFVHTGRRDVMSVDSKGISTITNGNMGMVFPWQLQSEPFDPDLKRPVPLDTMFEGCFDNLDDLQPQHAMALIKTWLYFLVFRNDAAAKPILALFGQPGSGKSTLFRRIYAFLYGGTKALNSITSSDDFDHAVSSDPLVVFDNVDTWVNWLPDKLALSAASSDLIKRKLYTDSDTIILRRQALVGITAHNPKFRREDIVDRLLMLNFHRLKAFKPESEIMGKVTDNRDALWGGLLLDLQRVLAAPKPAEAEIPQFRVNDFARLGIWISRALGYETAFREGLTLNASEQVAFNLEEEDILVDTIHRWLARTPDASKEWHTMADLWSAWSLIASDGIAFSKLYRNAVSLSKKLWALQDTLSNVFSVEYMLDKNGVRQWRFANK